ncbi:MAG: hypothetical protein ACI31G_05120 [Bacilli bacterium]
MDLNTVASQKLQKHLKNKNIKTIIVYVLFLIVLFTALGFSIAVFVLSKDVGTLFFLIITSIIIAFIIYKIIISTVLIPLFNNAFIQKNYLKAIKILNFSKKYGIGSHRIQASYLEILMYLYLDDINKANELVYSMNNYKPQYSLMCGFTSILLLLNNGKISEAKTLYASYYKQYNGSSDLLYIYKLQALDYLFHKIDNDPIEHNEGSSFFLDLKIYSRLLNGKKTVDNFDSLSFVSRADNEINIKKVDNPLLNKLFYWSTFSPLIGLIVGFILTVTMLAIDPTVESTSGLLILYPIALIPLTNLIVAIIYRLKTKNTVRNDRNIVSGSLCLFFLCLVATSGIRTHYNHDYTNIIALGNECNLSLPEKGKCAYSDDEAIKVEKKLILTYGRKATAYYSDSKMKDKIDSYVLSEDSKFVPLKDKNSFFGGAFALPIDYMTYGINEVDDVDNTYFLFYNKTLNTYNETFTVDSSTSYEVYIFSYYMKSGWLKITNYIS